MTSGIMATDSHLTDLVGHWLMHSSHPTIEVRCIPGGGGGGKIMCKSKKVINLDVNRFYQRV